MNLFKTYPREADGIPPKPVVGAVGLICFLFGFWASVITLRYFQHGAMALEADDAARSLAMAASLMFVASEMGGFLIAALLPAKRMWAQRQKLFAVAGAILAMEAFTIVIVQMSITEGAEINQQATINRAQDLRAQIAKIEANAAQLRSNAEAQATQAATAKSAWARVLAASESGAAVRNAADLDASTSPLYAELAKAEAQKRPTLISMLGEGWALAYVVVRGLLVSIAGLAFFSVAGAMFRLLFAGDLPALGRSRMTIAPVPAPAPAAPANGSAPVPAPAPAAPANGSAPVPAPAPAAPANGSAPVPTPAPAPTLIGSDLGDITAMPEAVREEVLLLTGYRWRLVAGSIAVGLVQPSERSVRDIASCNRDTAVNWLGELVSLNVLQVKRVGETQSIRYQLNR